MRGRDLVAIVIVALIIWLYWKSKKATKTKRHTNGVLPPVAGVPCCAGGPPPFTMLRKKKRGK